MIGKELIIMAGFFELMFKSNKWFVTGDTHGSFGRFYNLPLKEREDSEIRIIILGDAGWNFFLNKSDYNRKKECLLCARES